MSQNPYETPQGNSPQPGSRRPVRAVIGLTVCLIGAGISAYGAVAFWILNRLPPNDETSGRLPSLYVLFGGMALLLVGLTIRNLRVK